MMYRFPTINLKKTGDNITLLMKEHNISVAKLQEIFGFEYPQAIYKWRRGECLPTVDNLLVLSELFKTPIDKIIVKTEI